MNLQGIGPVPNFWNYRDWRNPYNTKESGFVMWPEFGKTSKKGGRNNIKNCI